MHLFLCDVTPSLKKRLSWMFSSCWQGMCSAGNLQFSLFFNNGIQKIYSHFTSPGYMISVSDKSTPIKYLWSYRPCLVPKTKIFTLSHQIFGHMHGVLNVGKKNQLHKLRVNCETDLLNLLHHNLTMWCYSKYLLMTD